MATKSIKGAQISASGGRPANLHKPTNNFSGRPHSVANVKGGPDLGGTLKESFFVGKQASGPKTVQKAKGFHLA